jgi:enoyl-CoA hydratase/carnithine racemase
VLACDMRFASRQNALFGNPEVGVGLIPGGGALEWLPRLVGRSRVLEIVLSADDFDADVAERYGWVNRAAGRCRPRLVCRYARPASGLVRP